MCGILGIFGFENITGDLISGLNTIQHRGQDSAGIVTLSDTFNLKKGLGLVNNVFAEKHLERLNGYAGLAHVRYSTMGSASELNAQPFALTYPFGLAMVHNGNVTNYKELKAHLLSQNHRLLESSNDVELILFTFASELVKKNLTRLSVDDIFDCVASTQKRVEGSFSTLGLIANKGFLAFTDSHGMRPVVMGKKLTEKGPIYAFASESTCFDYLGYETVRDLKPGEAVFIDMDRQLHSRILTQDKGAFCVFEQIYFAREDSVMHNKLVATERAKLGKSLAKKIVDLGIQADIVIDVPSSSYFCAQTIAEELKLPYRRGLAKNNFIGRSFIMPSQKDRELAIRQKLNPIKDVIKNKKVIVVDDSIVRGTTSRHIVKIIRDAGAKEVYFVSSAPPIKFPCVYGIDMSIKTELIAASLSYEEVAKYIGADAVVYQSIADLKEQFKDLPCCYACFDGEYPTKLSKDILAQIENERKLYTNGK